MTINEIEDYLKKKHVSMDQDVFDEIEMKAKQIIAGVLRLFIM